MNRSRRPNRESHIYNPSVKPLSKVFSHHEYFNYYKNLLVDKNMKRSTFNRMIEAESNQLPQFFRIKADGPYKEKLQNDFKSFLPVLKKSKVKTTVFTCLEEKYGTMAQVFFSPYMLKFKQNLQDFYDWLNVNTQAGFLSRFHFSSLIPFIFLDIQPSDSVISLGSNNHYSAEIISEILDDGYIFVNVPDVKTAQSDFGFGSPNYCVISYPILKIPDIQEFDKVLCLAPSIEDGSIRNNPGVESVWSIDEAIENHNNQKKCLISALEKVKVGGICVYSTYSINPFENEAVVSSVLKMKQFEGKFEIVDCENDFKEIKRKKGLTIWDLDRISVPKDKELMESISSDSLVENIDRCMRFYPHQTNSNGVFVCVIKKLGEIEKQYTLPLPQAPEDGNSNTKASSKWVSNLSKVPHSVIKKIIEDFGLPDECKKIPFIYSQTSSVNILFNVSKNLKGIFDSNLFNSLKICHIGARSFSFSSNYPDEPSIPSVGTLPDVAKNPTERLITITLDNFKEMTESCQIPVDRLSKANQAYLNSIPTGGIYIFLEDYGPILGGLWKDPVVRLIVKKGAALKLYSMAELALFKKEDNENENEGGEEEAKELEENQGDEIQNDENQEESKEDVVIDEATIIEEETPAVPVENDTTTQEEGEDQQQTHKRRRRRKSHKEEEGEN